MLPLSTDTIVLRRLHALDLHEFQSYRNDPVVGRYQGWSTMSDEAALEFLNEVATAPLFDPGQWFQIAICRANSERLIGDIGIHISEDRSQAEIGFTVAQHSQGLGLATSAVRALIALVFDQQPVQKIVAVTDSRNISSIRLLERLGMFLVSTADTVFRGEPCTEHTFALERPKSAA